MPGPPNGPALPAYLLKEIGADPPPERSGKYRQKQLSRKDQRKADRAQKKTQRHVPSRPPLATKQQLQQSQRSRHDGPPPAKKARKQDQHAPDLKKPRQAPKKTEETRAAEKKTKPAKQPKRASSSHDDTNDASTDVKPAKVSRATRDKLDEDDAEIAALEKRLGLKGRKGLPQSFKEDGLGDILGDLDGELDGEKLEKRKRKAEADDWLAQKRRKAGRAQEEASDSEGQGGSDDEEEDEEEGDILGSDLDGLGDDSDGLGSESGSDMDSLLDEGSEDGGISQDGVSGDEDDFGGFSGEDEPSDGEDESPPAKQRENPYVAPQTNVAKYVPPSRRQETNTDSQMTARIRRQVQGLVNRLTESNLVSIVSDFEKLYRDNPRQLITAAIVDVVLVQVCEPAALPDTLLILNAGFVTAIYKVIGMDFGAQLVQSTVERFREHHERALAFESGTQNISKETSNLITFIAELYTFQLIGCNLVFDYVRLLLDDLSELNAELLLRIVRMCGSLLRQDDPLALKDIVTLIRPAVARIGEANISVRTKFMIETINDLKNNKMKTGANASAVNSEHTIRMKKLLGTLSSRKLRSSEPLRIGLRDIEQSDKRGKWWLVGASWAGKDNQSQGSTRQKDEAEAGESDSDEDSIVLSGDEAGMPNLGTLAREQMMNTDVRRSIFISIISASDYEDACHRITKLKLNRDRHREIPNVIIQCAGAEKQYNPYYTLIAKRMCQDRKSRWAFQDSLWKLFRRIGESIFGDEVEDEDEDDEVMDMRRLVCVAKLYGSLVSSGSLGLNVLKCLNIAYLQPKTQLFVEVMLITALLEAGQKEQSVEGEGVSKMLMNLKETPELARGLQYFIKKVVRKSDLAGSKADEKRLKQACKVADRALQTLLVEDALEE